MLKTKKFICPVCEDIVTEQDILDSASSGGLGMCYCEYSTKDIDTGDVFYPRIFNAYIPLEDYEKGQKKATQKKPTQEQELIEICNDYKITPKEVREYLEAQINKPEIEYKPEIDWWKDWVNGDILERLDMVKNLGILTDLRALANEKSITDDMFNDMLTTSLNGLFEDLENEMYVRLKK